MMSATSSVSHLAIVAGGKGSRLASVMGEVPKALAHVGGKPLIQHQLELAARSGIGEVTIFAGYLADQIAHFVGDGAQFGVAARVIVENEPKGTAGALLDSLDLLPESFFIFYGDVMVAANLSQIAERHLRQHADFTAVVHPNDHPCDSDLLESEPEGWVTAIHPYPHPPDRFFANSVNAALYVARRDALRPWADAGKKDFAKDIMPEMLASGARILAYRSGCYIKDIGTPKRLEQVEADFRAGRIGTAGTERRPAVFLDRDGTLNLERGGVRSAQQLDLIPGAGSALRKLREAGFKLVVLTNQPVIARGEASEEEVEAVNRRLEWELGKEGAYLDAIYVCPHHPDSGFAGERPELKFRCECRKPATGMFERACRDLGLDRVGSWMIGDQTRDVETARRAGIPSILLRTGMAGCDEQYPCTPDYTADDLADAAAIIERQTKLAAS